MRTLALLIAMLVAVGSAQAQDKGVDLPTLGRSLVLVEIELSRREDIPRSPDQVRNLGYEMQERERLRELGKPLVFPGVVVGKGEVLFSDPRLEVEDYGKVFLRTWEGRRFEARLGGMLRDAPGMLVVWEPGEDPLPAVRFSALERPELATLRGVWIDRILDRIGLYERTARLSGLMPGGGVFLDTPFPPGAVLLDTDERPVGVALGSHLYVGPDGRSNFRGLDLLRTAGIPMDELSAAFEKVRARVRGATVRVRIEYHLPGKDEGSGFPSGGSNGNLPDDEGYGFLLPSGRVVLLLDPGHEKVRRIARVVALTGEGGEVREVEGTFVGALKGYEALFLSFPGLDVKDAVVIPAGEPPGRFSHCVLVTPERRFGRDRIKLQGARFLGEEISRERGKELRRPRLDLEPPAGSVLTDLDGRVLGIVTREKDEVAQAETSASPFGVVFGEERLIRVYWSKDVAAVWADPANHFDPRAVPRSRLGARRLVWLGVEFQYITKALAREIGLQKATRDGERGLLVNFVYPGSPAEKLGLSPGAVLLYILEEGKAENERREFLRPAYFEWRSDMSSYGGVRFAPRTNELTRMLTSVGDGKSVNLAWLGDGQERSSSVRLSEAPPDFDSAPKWKDERLGITVKDLTYEVRAFYRLENDFAGVIVSNVESGSPAEVAEVAPMAILHSVNGEKIADVAEYRRLTREILAEEGRNLTFFLKILAGARFVEVKPERRPESSEEDD